MKTCILVLLTVALFGFCGFVVWKINDFIYDHRNVTDANDIMEPEEIVLNENVSEEEMIAEIKHFRSTHAMTKVIVYDACKVKYPLAHTVHQNGNV